jgi:NhaP-type Na+/H+ and K+/H+ antiporter
MFNLLIKGNERIIPHGYTKLCAEDQLMIFADTECLAAIEQRLTDCKQI